MQVLVQSVVLIAIHHVMTDDKKNNDSSNKVHAQIEHNTAQYADFLAARDRLLDRLNATHTDITRLTSHVAETRRDFDSQLDHLRRQVAALVPPSQSKARSPTAPPSTPAS